MDGAPLVRTLLIVEDDQEMIAWLGVVLKRQNLFLKFAANGVEGVAMARALKPDGLLLDVDLPGMDGFEIFRTLRRELVPAPPTTVFFSAKALPGAFGMALDLGAAACVKKPCKPAVLRNKVFAALGLPPEPTVTDRYWSEMAPRDQAQAVAAIEAADQAAAGPPPPEAAPDVEVDERPTLRKRPPEGR